MSQKRNFRNWLIIILLCQVGFWGLAICKLVEIIFFENEKDMISHPVGSGFIYVFGVSFVFSLIVLVPFQVLIVERKDRKNRPKEKMRFADLLLLPFGAANPNAELPKWIAIPIKLLLFLLLAAILIPLIIAGIVKLFSG